MDNEDICVWPDGTYCTLGEVEEYYFMSDDYEVLAYNSLAAAHITGALEDACKRLFGHEFWQVINDNNLAILKRELGLGETT